MAAPTRERPVFADTAEFDPGSPILRELEKLTLQLEDLVEVVRMLEQRIDPVLTPEMPEPSAEPSAELRAEKPMPPISSLTGRLVAANGQLQRMLGRIDSLRQRVEL